MSLWAFQNSNTISTTGHVTTAVNCAYPTGVNNIDTLFLLLECSTTGQSWTISDGGFNSLVVVSTGVQLQLFYKVADGTESGNFTITNSQAKNSIFQCARFSGGPAAAAFAASIVATHTASGSSGSGIPRLPSLTIGANPNCLVIGAGGKTIAGTGINKPAVFAAEIGQDASSLDPTCAVWDYLIQTTAADITAGTWTIATGDSSVPSAGIIAAILPGASTFVPYPPLNNGGMNVQVCQ